MFQSLARRTLIVTAIAAALLVTIGSLSLSSLRTMMVSDQWVNHAYEVITAIEDVDASYADLEWDGHSMFSDARAGSAAYRRDAEELQNDLARLGSLIAERGQRTRLTALTSILQADIQGSEPRSDSRSAVDRRTAIRAAIDNMRKAEDNILRARRRLDEASAARANTMIWLGLIAGSFFVMAGGVQIASGIVRRQAAERALRTSETRLRTMFNTMLTGLFITDARGNIIATNPAFDRMIGVEDGSIVGRSVGEFVMLPSGPEAETLVETGNRIAGQTTQHEVRRADGRIIPVEVALTKFEADGQSFFAANWCDISERREIDRMKDEFVSVVSHELRTPLTSVRGALQLVLADPPHFEDPDHQPLLDIALNNCERLIRIINDILDVSKIEAGKLELHVAPCDARELARTSLQNVAEMARGADVTLVSDVAPDLPPIRGDFDRLVQVVVNLLSNAVKFAPRKSEVVLAAAAAGDRIALTVTDRGAGIAHEDLGKLFRKFRQLDSSATRKAGGTGLGLSIVKALVEQHGGSVSVASRIGEGTVFTVLLPAALDAARPAAVVAPSRPGRTILIVDDDADIRAVLRKQIEAAGYRVVEANDGQAAVAAAHAERPDLITMDLVMPGVGGLSAIRKLAADPITQPIPIVIVSAVADAVSFDHEFAIVSKPIDPDRLLREIETLIGRPNNATLLLAEDDDDLRGVLARSLARGGFRVVTAPDGDSARRLFDDTPCDAVVVDLHMPAVDGFGVIEHVRQSSERGSTPIIVVSGSNTGEGQTRAMQLGANVYFAKPVDSAALIRQLDQLVR